jgi:hypothetical protein
LRLIQRIVYSIVWRLLLDPVLFCSLSWFPAYPNHQHLEHHIAAEIRALSLPRFSPSPQLRCQSPSAGDWDVLSAGNADEALDVNAYLTEEIFDCSSAAGIAASESGALFSSWWDAAAAAVSSTVANAAAQPIIESNILNFLDDSHA